MKALALALIVVALTGCDNAASALAELEHASSTMVAEFKQDYERAKVDADNRYWRNRTWNCSTDMQCVKACRDYGHSAERCEWMIGLD